MPLSAGRQGSSEGFHLPSHISAFGEDSQELARVPSQKQLAGGANGPHRGHWNDNGFMDRGGMAAAMGLPKGNNPQASGSVGSTDDDPQLQRLAEGMMVAAIDSGGSTAGPDNSIWQPGQGSTSKPPGGEHRAFFWRGDYHVLGCHHHDRVMIMLLSCREYTLCAPLAV